MGLTIFVLLTGKCFLNLTKARKMASLDYLRLASFKFNYPSLIAGFMTRWPGTFKQGRWLQYRGWQCDSLFIGVGEQDDKRQADKYSKKGEKYKAQHMIISASGSVANDLARWMENDSDFYCTRLDVQRTIGKPRQANLRRIRHETKTKNTTIIQSQENDTLYIGTRSSDLFTRLYEKVLDDVWLRLEFELKGARSRAAWAAMRHGKTASNIFAHYLDKSKLPNRVKAWYAETGDDKSFEADRQIVEHGDRKKLKWLMSLDDCMEKALANSEIGVQVKELVRGWAKYADDLDKT